MRKILATALAFFIFVASFLANPITIYAEDNKTLFTDKNSALAEEQQETDDLRPLFHCPMQGIITSKFGYRKSGFHHGLDIANDWGTPITAVADGVIKEACWKNKIYGYAVTIDHGNGWESLYGHCGMLATQKGEKIKAGEIIAIEGSTGRSTGPHLHLEIHKDGVYLNPQNFFEEYQK